MGSCQLRAPPLLPHPLCLGPAGLQGRCVGGRVAPAATLTKTRAQTACLALSHGLTPACSCLTRGREERSCLPYQEALGPQRGSSEILQPLPLGRGPGLAPCKAGQDLAASEQTQHPGRPPTASFGAAGPTASGEQRDGNRKPHAISHHLLHAAGESLTGGNGFRRKTEPGPAGQGRASRGGVQMQAWEQEGSKAPWLGRSGLSPYPRTTTAVTEGEAGT